jgi:hypothetical protein
MLAEIFMVRLETRRRQAISQEGSSHGNSGQEFWHGRSNSGACRSVTSQR